MYTRLHAREEGEREDKSRNGDISGGWGNDRAKWRTWQAYQATNNKAHFDSFVDRTRCFQDLYETRRSSTNQQNRTNRKQRTRETYLKNIFVNVGERLSCAKTRERSKEVEYLPASESFELILMRSARFGWRN